MGRRLSVERGSPLFAARSVMQAAPRDTPEGPKTEAAGEGGPPDLNEAPAASVQSRYRRSLECRRS